MQLRTELAEAHEEVEAADEAAVVVAALVLIGQLSLQMNGQQSAKQGLCLWIAKRCLLEILQQPSHYHLGHLLPYRLEPYFGSQNAKDC